MWWQHTRNCPIYVSSFSLLKLKVIVFTYYQILKLKPPLCPCYPPLVFIYNRYFYISTKTTIMSNSIQDLEIFYVNQGPRVPQKLSILKSLEIQNLSHHRYRAFLLLQPSEIAFLSNSNLHNRRERPNRSINNGDMVEKA